MRCCEIGEVSVDAGERASRYCNAELRVHKLQLTYESCWVYSDADALSNLAFLRIALRRPSMILILVLYNSQRLSLQ